MRRVLSIFLLLLGLSALLPGIPAAQAVSGKQPALTTVTAAPSSVLSASGSGTDASGFFHAEITLNRETYGAGETAQASVRYTLDQNAIAPGDYVIVSIPADIAARVTFSVSRQHFSAVEDLGGGQYSLIFGEDAATGLSGSMTMRIKLQTDTTVTETIAVGDAKAEITVVAVGTGGDGVGTYADEALMKDGLGNEGMDFGGYEYLGGAATQIGLFDSTVDQAFTYRLYVNRKGVSMQNVTVEDTLPDGMYFDGGASAVTFYKMDPVSLTRTDTVLSQARVSIHGQTLRAELGDIDFPVEIEYHVLVPAQSSVQLRNRAEITYTQDGRPYKEAREYIAQGYDYSASNGVKSVDKTVISDDPADQWVTYTVRFWNENGFQAGEINLTDRLDEHVRFLYADDSPYFHVSVDDGDPCVLHIGNDRDIPASLETSVSFVCDFTRVPVGYTVLNSVGGNMTRTIKIGIPNKASMMNR